MHLVPRKVTWYTTTAIVAYITSMYLLLNLPIFENVSSLMRNIVTVRVSNDVYGLGTIMVDVRSLGRTKYFDVMTKHASSKRLNFVTGNRSMAQNICFHVSLNRNRTFKIKDESDMIKNQRTLGKHGYEDLNRVSKSIGTIEKNTSLNRSCDCYITVDTPPGRSGNQMFQMAALLGTAYNLDLIPVIPTNFPLSEWFELPNLVDFNLTNAQSFVIKPSGIYFEDVNSLNNEKNWTLRGYFQSWKYFRNSEDVVNNAFKIKDNYMNEAKTFIRNISKPEHVNVCVHVRRGDLGDSTMVRKGYAVAGLAYIYKAMNFYRRKFKKVQFIVLSDGIFWCMKNIKGEDVIFSPFYKYAEDMALMSLCDHMVVTSGTFGWWGAWLSGGTTVYFNGYPRPGSWLASQINRKDYYPPDWIPL